MPSVNARKKTVPRGSSDAARSSCQLRVVMDRVGRRKSVFTLVERKSDPLA